eukprot:gnl/TRDRNA2_/TRDRNA2_184056_c0_seq1.p1 gnl/TRDRNA2_/TRDRNA2_184056_c0~~gnl/TRDRNA2_/TRDRNA2_184056_c0_seq1.p1  ORF type:complete len:287 (+),score=36.96 gnl/TRDRNA2_/TRDRNA2_184056_c0_seq1:39-899(+)
MKSTNLLRVCVCVCLVSTLLGTCTPTTACDIDADDVAQLQIKLEAIRPENHTLVQLTDLRKRTRKRSKKSRCGHLSTNKEEYDADSFVQYVGHLKLQAASNGGGKECGPWISAATLWSEKETPLCQRQASEVKTQDTWAKCRDAKEGEHYPELKVDDIVQVTDERKKFMYIVTYGGGAPSSYEEEVMRLKHVYRRDGNHWCEIAPWRDLWVEVNRLPRDARLQSDGFQKLRRQEEWRKYLEGRKKTQCTPKAATPEEKKPLQQPVPRGKAAGTGFGGRLKKFVGLE